MLKLQQPADPKRLERETKKARMDDRKKSKPGNPTLKQVYDLLLDVWDELQDMKMSQ